MLTRWMLASLHLAALGMGFAAIWTRAATLNRLPAERLYGRVFAADTAWGLAALVWISTGVLRVFGGFEKGSAYYLQNHLFWGKMALLGTILLLEAVPMSTLIRWRVAVRRGQEIDPSSAPRLARISYLQGAIVLAMVFVATAMARGLGS